MPKVLEVPKMPKVFLIITNYELRKILKSQNHQITKSLNQKLKSRGSPNCSLPFKIAAPKIRLPLLFSKSTNNSL